MMKHRISAFLLAVLLAVTAAGCSAQEPEDSAGLPESSAGTAVRSEAFYPAEAGYTDYDGSPIQGWSGWNADGTFTFQNRNTLTTLSRENQVLETITLDKESSHFKAQLAQKYADIVYNGQWFTPLREALDAFADSLEKTVTGDVKLKLYKGNMINAGVTSPYTLYDEQTASFGEDDDYNQADSAGFINLFGLSIKERAKLSKNWPEVK